MSRASDFIDERLYKGPPWKEKEEAEDKEAVAAAAAAAAAAEQEGDDPSARHVPSARKSKILEHAPCRGIKETDVARGEAKRSEARREVVVAAGERGRGSEKIRNKKLGPRER